jgi:dihydrodipicolinate synthase/N-acetylneuraminate lyase
MDRNDVTWKGYWPACPTPFHSDQSLDLESFRALLEWYIGQGVHGLLVNGTSGEWFSQTTEERRRVAETAVAAAAGRVPVVVGCTSYTAREAIELSTHALEYGADGISSTPPPYSKTFPDETVQYFQDISDGIDGPILVYNWPHGCGVEIDPPLASRIADIDKVVGIKDSTPNAQQFYETTRTVVGRVRVFGPFMSLEGFEQLLLHGGDGFVGGGTLFGAPDPAFWESYWAGDFDACRAHAVRTDRLFPKLWLPGGWAGKYGAYQSQLKAIMKMLGQPGGEVRRPRLPVTDPQSLAEIRAVLIEESLLSETVGAA